MNPPLRLTLLLAALGTAVGLAWISTARKPTRAYPHPVDLAALSFVPLREISPTRLAVQPRLPSREGDPPAPASVPPVVVVSPERPGSAFWAAPLAELLRLEGFPVGLLPCAQLLTATAEQLLGLQVLATTGGCALGDAPATRTLLARGGTVLLVGDAEPDATTLGLLASSETSAPHGFSAGPAAPSLPPLPGLEAFLLPTMPPDARVTVSRTWRNPAGEEFPLVVRRRSAVGTVIWWRVRLPQAVALARQGDPTRSTQTGLLPHPTLADRIAPQVDPALYPLPIVDLWTHALAHDLDSSGAPIPSFWPFPTVTPSALIFTSDQDFADESFTHYVRDEVERFGGEVSIYLTGTTRRHAHDPPQAQTARDSLLEHAIDWQNAHHGVSIHPNANGLPHTREALEPVLDSAARGLKTRLGITPRTLRHHFLFWWEQTEPARVLSALGFVMELNAVSMLPGYRGVGFMTGSGLPLPHLTQDGEVLPIYQQATQLEDDVLLSKRPYAAGLTSAEALAASIRLLETALQIGTAVTTNVHPLLAVKEPGLLRGMLEATSARQVPIVSAERWLELCLARARAQAQETRWNGASLMTRLFTDQALWVRLPWREGTRAPLEVRLNDAVVSPADLRVVQLESGWVGTLVKLSPGVTRLEAHYPIGPGPAAGERSGP